MTIPNPIVVDAEVVVNDVVVDAEVATQYDLPIDLETLEADHNGDYSAPDGTAWDSAHVAVPGIEVEPLSVTENGTTTAPSGKAYSPVTVAVTNVDAEDKDINFYDVDGVRLFSYTREEFAALSALPTAPNRPDLFLNFTMWNWTKAEIDAQPGYVEVGALYDLTDCDFALVVEPTVAAQKDATLRFFTGTGNTVELDWGDGSAVETYNASSTQIAATHTWAELGRRYRIRLTRKAGTSRILPGGSTNANLVYGTHADYVSQAPVKEIFIGSNCTTAVTLTNVALLDRGVFCSDAEKKTNSTFINGIVIWTRNNNYSIAAGGSGNWLSRKIITAGNAALPIGNTDAFRQARNRKITIPNGATALNQRAFTDAGQIETLHIPSSLATVAGAGLSFANDSSVVWLKEIWFYSDSPPTLSASNSMTLRGNVYLIFPFAGLANYLEGTNWPGISQPSLAFATYNDGATLPTTDATQGYNVTWYASKEDAINERSPITTGNGKRIFCTIEEVTP